MQYGEATVLAARLDAGLEAGQKPQELDFTGFERYREACVQLLEMRRKYLGQMDLNLKSERVWAYYDLSLIHISAAWRRRNCSPAEASAR